MDGKQNVKITTSWLKSEDGRDWSVRIEGEAIDHCAWGYSVELG